MTRHLSYAHNPHMQAFRCPVMLSGYPSPLYASRLTGWRCMSYRTRTRGKTVTECLWCNFQEPGELHDWRFAGRTFRERLALKRLAGRWLARLNRMDSRKRGYVLDALSQYRHATPAPTIPAASAVTDEGAR